MIKENEVAMLLFGVGILLFILINRNKIHRIPAWKYLISGFYVLLAGWIFTVAEAFFWNTFFNISEHLCYALSAVILTIWCQKSFSHNQGTKK